MPEFIITLDIGTTSAKAHAFQSDGKVLAKSQHFYPIHYPAPGFAEQDPQVILQAVIDALSKVSKEVSLLGECVAMSMSCAMHGLIAVDSKNSPLTPLLTWADTRSINQWQALRKTDRASSLHKQTGTPFHPMSPLCKLLWYRDNNPELLRRAHKFLSMKEYVLFHLTGEYVIDHSLASATGLFDIQKRTWYPDALHLAGVSENQLSKPVDPSYRIKIKYPGQSNLPTGLDCIVGASDGCFAHMGSGAGEKDVSLTLGTSGALRIFHSGVIKDDHSLFTYILDHERLVCGGATNCGTALLDWFSDQMNGHPAALTDFVDSTSHIPAGSDGLLSLPFLLGERAPYYNALAKGVFFGVTVNHSRQHFQKALLEGICFQMRSILKSLESVVGETNRILAGGGFTRSRSWTQMMSSVLDRELTLTEDHDASSVGAAKFGFVNSGYRWTFEPVSTTVITPLPADVSKYEESFRLFENLYKRVEDFF